MEWIVTHILTCMILLPLLGAGFLLCMPSKKIVAVKTIALVTTVLTFVLSLHLVWHFQNVADFQFTVSSPWIPALGIQYALGVDGFSLWLVILTTFLMVVATLFSWGSIEEKEKSYYFFLLILETGMLGSLMALDAFLFYIFWEAMLIPMYFLIGIFGHGRRIYAALKFFIFTMVGSLLMLLAMIYLYFQADQSFLLSDWLQLDLPLAVQIVLFAAFTLSFAIKVPIVPVHTWLPDAHTDAPTAGSVLLAGVLLKMGTYGLVRFAMPLFPDALEIARPWLMALAVVGILYGALVAMVQKDMKRLVAYSSVAHLGFVVLGLMALSPQAVSGAVYQMLNHGISSGGLFLMVGMLYDRAHTQQIAAYGGLAKQMPAYTLIFLIMAFSSIALPSTNGFVGEFLILSGSFAGFPVATALATVGVILSAVYMLWMVERVFFGPARFPEGHGVREIGLREVTCMVPLVILVFWMGMAPDFFLKKIEPSTLSLLQRLETRRVQAEVGPGKKVSWREVRQDSDLSGKVEE